MKTVANILMIPIMIINATILVSGIYAAYWHYVREWPLTPLGHSLMEITAFITLAFIIIATAIWAWEHK